MEKLALFTAVSALAALGSAIAIEALTPASSQFQPNLTMSIEALHPQVDLKSLPEQEIKDLY
jgi:hypothetical protein